VKNQNNNNNNINFAMSSCQKVMLLEIQNAHIRDARITFDAIPHKYSIDGQVVPISCTGFVHGFFKEFDTLVMSERTAKGKNAKDPSHMYYQKTPEEIRAMWVVAADSGTGMHENIEMFWNNELHETESKEFQMFQKFKEQVTDTFELVPYRTEWIVFDDASRLCGSIDMVMQDPCSGNLFIFDWKRCRNITETNIYGEKGLGPCSHMDSCNVEHYILQLNTYKYILEQNYGVVVEKLCLVFLHPNQDNFKLVWCRDEQDLIAEMFHDRFVLKNDYHAKNHLKDDGKHNQDSSTIKKQKIFPVFQESSICLVDDDDIINTDISNNGITNNGIKDNDIANYVVKDKKFKNTFQKGKKTVMPLARNRTNNFYGIPQSNTCLIE